MRNVCINVLAAGIVMAIIFSGCSNDQERSFGPQQGGLRIALAADGRVADVATRATTDEETQPNVDDFTVSVLRGEEVMSTWEKFSQYPDEVVYAVGSYTLQASYGQIHNEGFGLPYYAGSKEFTIRDGETTEVELTCYLANVKVSVVYTDMFRKYFSEYSAKINTDGNSPVTFAAEESRPAYFRPGDLSVTLDVTKREGGTHATYEAAVIRDAKPQTHYRITCDVNAGSQTLNISFDEATDRVPVTINVSDESMRIDPPFFLLYGFTSGTALEIVEGKLPSTPTTVYLNARSGIDKCVLNTSSAALLALGWPEELDLANLSDEQQRLADQYGVKMQGLGANKENIATIDLTSLIRYVGCDGQANESSFLLTATDKLKKVNEAEVKLVIKSLDNQFAIEAPDAIALGSNTLTFRMTLDGDPSNVTATYYAFGSDQPLPLTVVSSNANQHVMQGTMGGALTQSSTLKVTCGTKTLSAPITLNSSSN